MQNVLPLPVHIKETLDIFLLEHAPVLYLHRVPDCFNVIIVFRSYVCSPLFFYLKKLSE